MNENSDLSALNNKQFAYVMILLVAFSFAFVIIGYAIGQEQQPLTDQRLTYRYTTYWACMDGCSNMLEVEYGTLNESLHPLQTKCDTRCEEQYWRGGLT